ncbi:MAG: type IV pilus twitching motility protein PilT [Myxococcota bacterium]
MAKIDTLLRAMDARKGSDLHLAAGQPPRMRVRGELVNVEALSAMDDVAVGQMLYEICPPDLWKHYDISPDIDFAYALPGVGRFRVNCFRQENGRGAVVRLIPERIVPLEELGMPAAVESLAHARSGLVLITGATGSGKSTTAASIIDKINRTYARHIVTIEDPIEFVHPNKKSIFSHREVGRHTGGFGPALRAALRQNADVVLVGELRDQETVRLALSAAEMGLLVFGTVHTNSAPKAIDRILDIFPAEEQAQARLTLSECLTGVLNQVLVKSADGKGRVCAVEILLRTPALPNLIREGTPAMLYSAMQSGKAQGMQTMDMSLRELVDAGRITREDALWRATDKGLFGAA